MSEMGNKAFQWTFSSNLVNPNTNSSNGGANTLGPLAVLGDANICEALMVKKKTKGLV